ncbi:MAG TPA: hypothetical protein VF170_01875 [Planctomycetaceae bacterium]
MTGVSRHDDRATSWVSLAAFLSMALAAALLTGCVREEEKVLDIETPGGSIEVYEQPAAD